MCFNGPLAPGDTAYSWLPTRRTTAIGSHSAVVLGPSRRVFTLGPPTAHRTAHLVVPLTSSIFSYLFRLVESEKKAADNPLRQLD